MGFKFVVPIHKNYNAKKSYSALRLIDTIKKNFDFKTSFSVTKLFKRNTSLELQNFLSNNQHSDVTQPSFLTEVA